MPLYAIYIAHLLFWSPGGVRILADWMGRSRTIADAPTVEVSQQAPRTKAAVIGHCVAFFFLYYGIGRAVFGGADRVGSAWVGLAFIVLGLVLFAWALLVFRSWRLLAKLDEGHQLCTAGPYGVVRHPIYTSLDLLAIGSAIWIPLPEVILGAILILVFSDLRAKMEERLLLQAFGERYREQMRRVKRFLPGIY